MGLIRGAYSVIVAGQRRRLILTQYQAIEECGAVEAEVLHRQLVRVISGAHPAFLYWPLKGL